MAFKKGEKVFSKTGINFKTMLIGVLIIGLVVIGMELVFITRLQNLFRQETRDSMVEVNSHIHRMISDRIATSFHNLETLSDILEHTPSQQDSGRDDFLTQAASRYHYRSLAYSGPDGKIRDSFGNSRDISKEPFFIQALQGENVISDVFPDTGAGDKMIVYAVPVRGQGQVIGVLMAMNPMESLRSVLSLDSFHGEGYVQIINGQGDFIIQSKNKNAPQEFGNMFQLIQKQGTLYGEETLDQLKQKIQSKEAGWLHYRLDGTNRYMVYSPLGENDWYLLTIVPSDVMMNQANRFILASIVMCGGIVVLFLLLFWMTLTLQAKSRKRLQELAFVDPLTKGYNKNRFEMEASGLLREGAPNQYAMVTMDVERFKLVNDRFGQVLGDQILAYIYQVISGRLESGEAAARTAGDEFHILMQYSNHDAFKQRLRDIQDEINQFPLLRENRYYLVTAWGIYPIEDPNQDIVAIQDRARVAKENAKGHAEWDKSCVFYNDMIRMEMIRDKEMENRMREALKQDRFVVYYQPKYDINTNRIAGAEALARWNDPEWGLMPPMEFIPLFERNGFIVEVDLYVFEQVCRTLKRWKEEGRPIVPISVNVSRRHLENPNFLEEYETIRKRYQIPASWIEFELTETLVTENMEILLQVIDRIHQLGFTCSLDDFGSGYSSLNLLKDVPVDVLKLDRAFFLTRPESGERGNSVVESVIALAKKLEIQTVSEGVETVSQVEFLRQVHCDLVQGYVFSKPVPIGELEKLMISSN